MQRIMLKKVQVPVVVDQEVDTEISVRTAYNGTITLAIGMTWPHVAMELSPAEALDLAKMLLCAATEPPPF